MIKELQSPNGNKIILVGTAHVSKNSVDEVTQAIRTFKPSVVAVEACDKRYDLENDKLIHHEDSFLSCLKNKEFYQIYGLGIGTVEHQLSLLLEADLGAEMETAIKEGKVVNAEIILADQDIDVTLKNIWDELSIIQKIIEPAKFMTLAALIKILRLANAKAHIDFDNLISKANVNPELFKSPGNKSLVEDRNKILAENIYKNIGKGDVLAVVGGYHVSGLIELLKERDPSIVEIIIPEVKEEKIIDYNNKCSACGKGYNTNYKGIVNREVIKCECGAIYYYVSVHLLVLNFSMEMKPNTEKDVKFLKFVYGSKLHERGYK